MLTGLIVPLGFLALVLTFVWARLADALAKAVGFCAGLLLATSEMVQPIASRFLPHSRPAGLA